MSLGSPPYSPVRRAGDTLYVSGQLALRDGAVVGDGIAEQTRLTLENLRNVLEAEGASLGDVVRCQVFLSDMADWPGMNEVYREVFGEPFPSRSAIGVQLIEGALVEIDAVAYIGR